MALDFPNSPVVGSTYTSGPGGPAWQWDGVKWESIGVPGATGAAGPVSRNLLHNPYFNIQQRGQGPWTATSYMADRWLYGLQTDTITASIISLVDADRAVIGDEAAQSAFQAVFAGSATSGSYSLFLQRLESVRRTSNKTLTVSFWARATSGTPRIGVGWIQNFGAGGSPSAQTNGSFGVTPALSTTWQRYSYTGALPSAAGKTFGTTVGTDYINIEFWLSDQGTYAARSGGIGVQSGTVQLWGTQCEIGPIATPLEKIDPRFDLANCQRFYQVATVQVAGYNTAGSGQYSTWYFVVTMRAAPTVGWLTGPSGANSSVSSFAANDNHSAVCNMAYTATGSAYIGGQTYASADL